MKQSLLLIVVGLLIFAGCGGVRASNEKEKRFHDTSFRFSEPVGEQYLTLTIISHGKVVRTLQSTLESGGAYEPEALLRVSPDGGYAFLNQIESATLETPNGPTLSETAYCNLVNVDNGCIVARATGEFCAGFFTLDGKWNNSVYPDFKLDESAPRISAYADGTLKPAGSPDTSLENLMACDPPNTKNIHQYRNIIKNKLFKLDDTKKNELELQFR